MISKKKTSSIPLWGIIAGFLLVVYAYYHNLSVDAAQQAADNYFGYTERHAIEGPIALLGLVLIVASTMFMAWNIRKTLIFIGVFINCAIQAQQIDNNSILGYTTKNDTFLISSKKELSESDKHIFSRAKELIAFYKATEKKEHRNGRPFRQLKENGLPVFWRNMPVFVLQRERKEGGKRIIYDIHVVAFEQLKGDKTTEFQWVIVQ